MEKALDEYIERMAYFPTLTRPRPIGKDEEFIYFEFIVPKVYLKEVMRDRLPLPVDDMDSGDLDIIIVNKMGWYPVHTGIEEMKRDKDCVFYKVRVPKVFIASKYGVVYRRPREF